MRLALAGLQSSPRVLLHIDRRAWVLPVASRRPAGPRPRVGRAVRTRIALGWAEPLMLGHEIGIRFYFSSKFVNVYSILV